ncbi:hypothetical protein [Paraburkholderia domus]|uniref:Uncharacterized protein n=1 Tax=Paraburkholderia domus TaxID=2793075 RepID=A0A9N8MM73_9BURK|nr:hypothetical protein [Paraburkholderia domus]MBK5164795.1 hypothetical protein [Burkholderia sp. R-70211]CAE6872687.1 hypothetical protein R70211_01384 [Paraburkholderia domus]
MNSSAHFIQSRKQAEIRTIYVDNGPTINSKMVADVLYVHQPAARPRVSWEDYPCPTTSAQRTVCATEEPNYQGLPPLGLPVACGDHEPHLIRFLDGADSVTRSAALQARMRQLCVQRGRKLLVLSKPGELSTQLDRMAIHAAALYARCPERLVVVGIDGIDQYLESPSRIASQLKTLIDGGVTVACAVDGRYRDSHLLTFHLRTLGVIVIRERLATESGANESAVCKSARFSPAPTSVTVRRFPEVLTPALAAYVSKVQRQGATTEMNSFVPREEPGDAPELRQCRRSENAVHFTSTELERAEYARAYRNDFAMNRLLCEWKSP